MCEDPYPDDKSDESVQPSSKSFDTDFLDPPGFDSGKESRPKIKPVRRKIFSNEVGM